MLTEHLLRYTSPQLECLACELVDVITQCGRRAGLATCRGHCCCHASAMAMCCWQVRGKDMLVVKNIVKLC